MGEIINKVAKRDLVQIDLEEYYPKGERLVFDISEYLFEGFVLKEKDFRKTLEEHDWSQYQNHYVALTCSTDAIIPSWAYLLLSTKLVGYAKKVVTGDLNLLETLIYQEIIEKTDFSNCTEKPVIIKGCAKKVPSTAYNLLITKIQPIAKSIMFGEACSVVPLHKNK